MAVEPRASSGDYAFNPSAYAIITGAMRLIGAIQSGEVPPAEEYDDALASLNGLIHTWQTNDIHVWAQTTIDVPLVAGQTVYQIGIGAPDMPTVPRPLKITEGRFIIGNDEIPLIPLSRWDYANLSNKGTPSGAPAQYFYDAQIPYGRLVIYPSPSIPGLCRFIAQRPLQSFNTQRDTADVPQEWISALRFALAVELGPEYDVPAERLKIVKELADEKLNQVTSWDSEHAGTTTLPYTQAVYQLVAGSLRLCGGCGAQDTPTLGLINNAFYSLNAMVQQWQGMGIHLWTERDCTLFLQPGQRTYRLGVGSPDHCCETKDWIQTFLNTTALFGSVTIEPYSLTGITVGDHIAVLLDAVPGTVPPLLQRYHWTVVTGITGNTVSLAHPLPAQAVTGARVISYTSDLPRPLRVPAARRMVYPGNYGTPSHIETPLAVYSRIDYAAQTSKGSYGAVSGFFFDPQLGFAEFHTWPSPADAHQAVQFTAQLPLTTFADLATADNFPVEWNNALRYCLAVEMWPEHSERRAAMKGDYNIQLVKALADEKLQMAMAWDREPESVYFGLQTYSSTRNG